MVMMYWVMLLDRRGQHKRMNYIPEDPQMAIFAGPTSYYYHRRRQNVILQAQGEQPMRYLK